MIAILLIFFVCLVLLSVFPLLLRNGDNRSPSQKILDHFVLHEHCPDMDEFITFVKDSKTPEYNFGAKENLVEKGEK